MRAGGCVLVAVLLLAGFPLVAVLPAPAAALTARGPVLIDGDADFTAANGVVGGTGTVTDPYVIGGWDVTGAFPAGVEVQNTRAHFVLRDSEVHSGGYPGLRLYNVENGSIENVTFRDNAPAIQVEQSQGLVFARNTAIANWNHVFAFGVANATFDGNSFVGSTGGGVFFVDVVNITVTGNGFDGPRDVISVSGFVNSSLAVRIENNTLLGAFGVAIEALNTNGLVVANNTISGAGGLRVIYCTAVEIRDNNISATEDALEVGNVSGASVVGNLITGVANGGRLSIYYTENATIVGNSVDAPRAGILLSANPNMTVSGNQQIGPGFLIGASTLQEYLSINMTSDNTVDGLPFVFAKGCSDMTWDGAPAAQFLIVGCQRIAIRNQAFVGRNSGIQLAYVQDAIVEDIAMVDMANVDGSFGALLSSNITLRRANFTANQGEGAAIFSSTNVSVTDSTFRANFIGVRLYLTTNARVLNNNFIKNSLSPGQVIDDTTPGSLWDNGYPGGGNYWSHYDGLDRCSGPAQNVCTGGDGLGDSPLDVYPSSVDRYPMIKPIGLPSVPPVAVIAADPRTVEVGQGVFFDGLGSSDEDGSVVEFAWDFGDGETGNGSSVTHGFAVLGTHTVTLTVRDNSYEYDSAIVEVSVTAPPVIPMIVVTGPQPLYVGQLATFDAGGSYTSNGTITAYDWDFRDGTTATGPLVQHAFSSGGTYAVRLTVTSNWGIGESGIRNVEVLAIPAVTLRPYEHRSGFRVPVPESWSLTEDEVFEGVTFETVLVGPVHDGFAVNLVIDTGQDPLVREDAAHLAELVNETLRGAPGASLLAVPTYRTIAGHAGVVFSVVNTVSGAGVVQRMAIVVSEAHGRYWALALSASSRAIFLYNATFDRMTDGFEITAQPTNFGGSVLVFGLAIAGVVAGVLIFVAFIVGRRRRMTSEGPTPTQTPRDGGGPCASCGTAAPPGSSVCAKCGSPLPREPLHPIPNLEAGRPDSGTPPTPPP
jgi:PKD repeat protein